MFKQFINVFLLSSIAMLFLAPSADAAGTKTITRGQSAVINWNVTGAPSCSPDTTYPNDAGDSVYSLWSGAGNNTTGFVTFSNVYSVNTSGWVFSCVDLNSGISDSARLIVNDCTAPQVWNGTACVAPTAPTADITQDTTSTVQGTPFYISWSSTNASSCTVTYSGPLSGTLSSGPTSGGPVEMNPGTTGTYTATNTCTNGAGVTASKSISHTVTTSAQPDLTAGSVSPTSATPGVAVTLSATISNGGAASTGSSFNNFIQVATASNGGGTITDLASASMTMLTAGASNTTSRSYTFSAAGTYSVRACADKSSSGDAGTITESNEGNNCGAWTNIAVSSSSCTLPWGGTIASGQSVTAYQSSSVTSPATCQSQTRTCTNGTLSGTYTNQTCTVESTPPGPSFLDIFFN